MICASRRPLCNGRPHTAPRVFGVTFPLCWRCTSLAVTVLVLQFALGATMSVHWGVGVFGAVLVLMGAYDGYRSYFTPQGTTNRNRAVFGALLGVGLVLVTLSVQTSVSST